MIARRLILGFVFGAIVGTALDRIHTYWGVTQLTHALLWGESWWVPLVFGGAGVMVIFAPRLLRRLLGESAAPGSTANVVFALVWFVAVYFASGIFAAHPSVLAAAFLGTWLVRGFARRSTVFWLVGVVAAILGPVIEHMLTGTLGLYRFLDPQLWGGPIWLPAFYPHAAALGDAIDTRWPQPASSLHVEPGRPAASERGH